MTAEGMIAVEMTAEVMTDVEMIVVMMTVAEEMTVVVVVETVTDGMRDVLVIVIRACVGWLYGQFYV